MPDSYSQETADARWWKTSRGQKPHEILWPVVSRIRDANAYRRDTDLMHARLFGNVPAMGLGAYSYARSRPNASRLSLNVVRNMVCAVQAKISKNKPKPAFFVKGGDYKLNIKAKKLEKFIEGQFYQWDLYTLGPEVFRDACIFGTGVAKVYVQDDEIKIERVFPWEIYVDDGEARYGTPRSLYQVKYYDRQVLAELFPDSRGDILQAPRGSEEDFDFDSMADQVKVVEAWHLPSSKKSKDGRHVICVGTATLLDEKWSHDFFPFSFVRWSRPIAGWFGEGLAAELVGIQLEINKLLRNVQQAHHTLGVSHWMVERGAKVNLAHVNNDQTSILEYGPGGAPPQVYTPSAVPQEVYSHLWALYQKAYEVSGISQLTAQSSKPAGLNSGEALKTYHDIETERFIVVGREYEQFYLDIARLIISAAKELTESHGSYKVKARSKSFIETIDWKDVDLDADEYDMTLFPVSEFPSNPIGKLDFAEKLVNLGVIKDPAEVRRAFNFNEFQQDSALETAPHELILQRLSRMLDDGEYFSPEPFQDLADTLRTTQLAYERAQLDGVEEARLELLRQYMADTHALMAPPPPPPGPPPGPPAGPVGPPPPPSPPPGGSPAMAPPMAA